MPTCDTCQHWKPLKTSLRDGPCGTCHAGPPRTDYQFPRTRAVDHCAQFTAKPEQGRGKPSAAIEQTLFDAPGPAAPADAVNTASATEHRGGEKPAKATSPKARADASKKL